MSGSKTEHIRILVAIDRLGCIEIAQDKGDDKDTWEEMREHVGGWLTPPIGFHWIEADIPLPTVDGTPIPATVTPAEDPPA